MKDMPAQNLLYHLIPNINQFCQFLIFLPTWHHLEQVKLQIVFVIHVNILFNHV